MIIERLTNAQDLNAEIERLTPQEKQDLFQEVEQQKQTLQNEKIQYETQLKTTQDSLKEIDDQLKNEFGLNSIQEAQTKITELETEINQGIANFITALRPQGEVNG